jgi:hypothetical protein
MKVPKELVENLKSSGIKQVIVKKTGDACTEYNKLCKKKKKEKYSRCFLFNLLTVNKIILI